MGDPSPVEQSAGKLRKLAVGSRGKASLKGPPTSMDKERASKQLSLWAHSRDHHEAKPNLAQCQIQGGPVIEGTLPGGTRRPIVEATGMQGPRTKHTSERVQAQSGKVSMPSLAIRPSHLSSLPI